MKWQISLSEPWYSGWLTLKVRANVHIRFTADEVFTISELNLYDDRLYDFNSKGEGYRANIWTIRDFFPEAARELRFENWSEAHDFKAQFDAILSKLNARLGKLIPELMPEPEPDPEAPKIPESDWQAHGLLMSGSGSGKTNAMRWRILQLLDQVVAGRASMIVMEPKGTLTAQILGLAQLYEMRDRVVVIDPADVDNPASVNIFERAAGSRSDMNSALAMANYVLDTMTMTLQPSHRQVLAAVNQLMFALPEEPWMGTLLETLRHGAVAHKSHFLKLTRATRDFFEHEYDRPHSQTQRRREELLGRLNNLLGGDVFDRLLYQRRSTFNLLEAMQRGSLILINANEDSLGFGETTVLYGKFWTAQIYKAGLTRLRMLAQGQRLTPVWVFIDEAQTYVTDDLMFGATLDKLREARIGVLAAMHYLGQIESTRVRSAIDINTAVKFSAIPKTEWHWQCETPRVSGKVFFPWTDFRELPQMTAAQRAEVLQRSRSRYADAAPDGEPHHAEPADEPEELQRSEEAKSGDRGDYGPL